MIYISQGHEKSIALEILIRSICALRPSDRKFFTLVCLRQALLENLKLLEIPEDVFFSSGPRFEFFERDNNPPSTSSLLRAIDMIDNDRDILLTLPTSKDQLIHQGRQLAGHTEFFRQYYNRPNLGMNFFADDDFILLITDHIPLCKVAKSITAELIVEKVTDTVNNADKYFSAIEEVIIAGINPHAGENGILGDEDSCVKDAVASLKKIFPKLALSGPLSGDTLHFYKRQNRKQLKVYMYHDQGLPLFKAQHGVLGLNITFGLPFLRMSVDHGTAFDLYGKGIADFAGCLYMLQTALKVQSRISALQEG